MCGLSYIGTVIPTHLKGRYIVFCCFKRGEPLGWHDSLNEPPYTHVVHMHGVYLAYRPRRMRGSGILKLRHGSSNNAKRVTTDARCQLAIAIPYRAPGSRQGRRETFRSVRTQRRQFGAPRHKKRRRLRAGRPLESGAAPTAPRADSARNRPCYAEVVPEPESRLRDAK